MKIVTLLLLVIASEAGKDYYKLLGVPKNADSKQIKKAFKKASLKYHPDKNPDNREEAQQKYMEIANAYEVLTDEEQRAIYDKYGEQGLKDGRGKQQQGGMNYEDVFGKFFGGGGGGRHHFNFGGGGGHHQQQKPQYEALFEKSDVLNLEFSSLSQLFRRNMIWLVNFYHPGEGKSKMIKDEWIKLAEKLYGIIKIAAVNCDEEEELCEEYEITSRPTIIYFPESTAEKYQVYKGKKTAQDIADFAIPKMQSFVQLVKETNFEEFLNQETPKVLLFTERKTTSPLLKVLSKELKGKLAIGEVRSSEAALVARFGITKFPTLMGLTSGSSGEIYDGEQNRDKLERWMRNFMYSAPKIAVGVREFTKSLQNSGNCNKDDATNCLFIFLNRGESTEIIDELQTQYNQDPIKFYWVDQSKYAGFHSDLGGSKVVILRAKRKKYFAHSGDISESALNDFVSLILSGGGSATKLSLVPEMIESKGDL